MKSFQVDAKPRPAPRLAAAALLFHGMVAGLPWLCRLPPLTAAGLSLLALAGLFMTLAWVPGEHCRLRAARCQDGAWSIRLRGESGWTLAQPGSARRVLPGLVVVSFPGGRHRLGWILSRQELPASEFRRLKARLRLSC